MLKLFASTALAVGFTSVTAFAGGFSAPVVTVEPVVAAATSARWEGGYVGAHVGYGSGKVEDINNPRSAQHDTDGLIGGIQIGYNWQLPSRVVFGIEADLSAADIKAKWTDSAYYGQDKHKLVGSIRGRIGYDYDGFLPYLHGGLAWAKNEHTLNCGINITHGTSCDEPFNEKKSDNVTGYVIGAGVEYAIDQSWSLKGEYAYTNYGKNRLMIEDINFPDSPVNNRNFKSDHHSIKLGVNYRF